MSRSDSTDEEREKTLQKTLSTKEKRYKKHFKGKRRKRRKKKDRKKKKRQKVAPSAILASFRGRVSLTLSPYFLPFPSKIRLRVTANGRPRLTPISHFLSSQR